MSRVESELEPDPIRQLGQRLVFAFRHRFSSRARVTIAALGLILIQLGFRAWASYGSWFMWDDYRFLADVRLGNDDWSWLFHSHFNLFMPVSFVLVKLVGGIGAFNWGLIATQMLLLQALTSLSCWWMLRTLFGDKKLILVPLTFYLFVPLTVPMGVWWSVAINQYPHHIAIFGAVAAHVAYARSRKLRFAFVSTAFLALGLGSYVKAPLIVIVLVGLSWAFFTDGPIKHRIARLWDSWPAWSMYLIATFGYAWIWQSKQVGVAPRHFCELPGTFGTSILDSVGTGMVGGPWRWSLWTGGTDPFITASNCVPQAYKTNPGFLVGGAPQSLLSPPLVGLIFAWLLIFAALAYLWARYADALRCFWFVVPYVLITVIWVFLGRTGVWGSQISAREIRYFSDFAAVMSLGMGTMLLPILGASVRLRPRTEPYFLLVIPRWTFWAAGAIFVIGSIGSSIGYIAPWHTTTSAHKFPERVFTQHIIRQLELTKPSALPVEVADVPLPARIALPVIAPYNLPSRKFAPLQRQLKATTAGTDLKVIDNKGDIQPGIIPDAPRSDPGPVADCGYLIQSNPSTIPIVPVVDLGWWISADYLASRDGTVTVQVGKTTRQVAVKSGLHTLFVHSSGAFSGVEMKANSGISVCVDNIRVGNIQAER